MKQNTTNTEPRHFDLKSEMHYYGDSIRKHMMIIGGLLLVLILLDQEVFLYYLIFGLPFVVISFILAGITNPQSWLSIMFDFIVSLVTFCFFEYFALAAFAKNGTIFDLIFLLRQIIAIISIGSLYLTSKTLRGMYYRYKGNDKEFPKF